VTRATLTAGFLVCLLMASRLVFAVDPTQLPTPELQARYLSLTHELRCMQCQNESIADSPVSLAADLRREVARMLVAGKSDEDVRNFMVARYGEFILFRPRFSTRNFWLWATPGVLLLIGAFVAVRVVSQRSKLVDQDQEPLEEDIRSS
jgi:cytochrome c-type biogenesis protein CcmH